MSAPQLTDLDLRLLRVLDALLETNSVTRAAAILEVTPSAISHSLRDLRRVMGDPLFVRTGSALRPTQFALAVRPSLRSALVGLRHILDGVPGFDPSTSRRIFSIVMPEHLVPGVLAPAMKEVARCAPHAQVRLHRLTSDSHAALASGELDLVLTAGHSERFLSLDRGMMRVAVRSQRFVCILRENHPVLATGQWDAETYAGLAHIFVSLSGATRSVIDEAIEREGLSRHVALTMPSDASVAAMVEMSDMVATIPEELARQAKRSYNIAILAPPFDLPLVETYLWWHSRFQYDPAHVWWRGQIAAAVRSDVIVP